MMAEESTKTLNIALPITDYDPYKQIFLAESWATGEHEGWTIQVDRSGRKVILHLTKGERRVTQSIEVGDLINGWVEQAVREQD